jgi:hypothetical protein
MKEIQQKESIFPELFELLKPDSDNSMRSILAYFGKLKKVRQLSMADGVLTLIFMRF